MTTMTTIATVVGLVVLLMSTMSVLLDTEPNECEMSFMHPSYVELNDTMVDSSEVCDTRVPTQHRMP